MGRILCKLAPLVLAAPVDIVAQQVHGSDGGEGCPGKRRGNTNKVAGHQGGQEGEGEVGRDERPSVAGVKRIV